MARHDSGRIGRKHGLLSRLDRRPIRLSEDNADRHGRSPARGRKGSRAVLHAGEGRDKSPHPGKISLRGLRPSPESAPGVTRVHANAATALAPAFLDARCRNPDLGRPRAVFRCLSIRGRLMSLIKSISSMHRWRRTGGAVAAHSRSLHQESAQGGGGGVWTLVTPSGEPGRAARGWPAATCQIGLDGPGVMPARTSASRPFEDGPRRLASVAGQLVPTTRRHGRCHWPEPFPHRPTRLYSLGCRSLNAKTLTI